mgnify:CR=1 FL=1
MNNEEYLEFLRKKNKQFMSKCFYCDRFAITIKADGYNIYPVCKNHDDRTLDEIEKDIE